MLMLTHPGAMAVAARSQPTARVTHGCLPGHVRVGGSVSPRLTAKLTANPHDDRGSQRTPLDGYIRPELRRCGGRVTA